MDKKTNESEIAGITTNLFGDNRGIIHSGNGNINVGLNIDPKDLLSLIIKQIPGLHSVAEIKTERSINDIIGIPPLPVNICKRGRLIENQVKLFNNKTWLNFYGDVWSGKTSFVALLAKQYPQNVNWFRIKGLNDNQVCIIIKLILNKIAIYNENGSFSNEIHNYEINIKQNSIIVLDDLPTFSRTSPFLNDFIKLLKTCKELKIKLITTTQRCVQELVQLFLNKEDYESIQIPEFEEEDIEQMLELYNANSEYLNEKFISFLKIKTKGNPALANAVCCYMSKENWLINSSGIIGLIDGEYYWQINSEVQDILYSTIDDECRELLYRISEIGWSVSGSDIVSISGVNPAIKLPMEKVNKLLGSWIILDAENKYVSSPLISKLSSNNIANDTRKGIHDVIAKNILAKRVLNTNEAVRVIAHLLNAENYIGAGLTYINLLNKMHQANINDDYEFVSWIWYNTPLPELMPIDIRIPLRAVQIIYCYKSKKDINYLLNDFEMLLQTCPNHLKVFYFYVAIFIYKIDVKKANQYIISSLNELPKIVDMAQKHNISDTYKFKEQIDSLKPETAFLITSSEIKTPDDLMDWVETIKGLSQEQLKNLFNDDMFPDSYLVLPSRVWLSEREKIKELCNWSKVLDSIDYMIKFALENSLELLWACSVRVKVIIFIEELDEFDNGIKVGIEAIEQASNDPLVQYVLNDIIAKEYAYRKEYEKAILMFNKIIGLDNIPFNVERVTTYLRYSEVIEQENKDESIKYSYMAVRLAEKLEGIKKYYYVQVLVEHIICLWNCGRQGQTPMYIEEAVERILDCKEDDTEWKKVFMVTGHILGYYIPVLDGDKPPEKLLDGEEYTVPYRMLSLKEKPNELAELFDETKLFLSPLKIFLLFKHLNCREKAIKWAKVTYSLVKAVSDKQLLLIGYYDLGHYLWLGGEYDAAFRVLIYFNFLNTLSQQNNDLDIKSDTEFYFENAPDEIKNSAELNALLLWSVPAFVNICTSFLIDENEAEKEATLVVNVINSFKNILINKKLCDDIINVINITVEKRTDFNDLIKLENSDSTNNKNVVKVMAYLAAILFATPEQSIDVQLKIGAFIDSYFSSFAIAYESIVRFLKSYWIAEIDKGNKKFGVSWKTKSKIENIDEGKGVKELKKLLGIIVSVLDVNLSDEIINWFEKD